MIGWVAAHGEGMDGYKYFSASFPFNKNSSPSALVDDVECTSDEELRTGQQIQKSFMCGMDDPAAYVLPALLYFWQLPHFMSLAWIVRYEINDTGDDTTKFQSFMQYYSHCGS